MGAFDMEFQVPCGATLARKKFVRRLGISARKRCLKTLPKVGSMQFPWRLMQPLLLAAEPRIFPESIRVK